MFKAKFIGVPNPVEEFIRIATALNTPQILDVGAHHGDVTDRFLRIPNCHVHSFEPHSKSYEILKKRFSSDERVSVYKEALSDTNRSSQLHLFANEQANSLVRSAENVPPGLEVSMKSVGTESVKTSTLDSWYARNCCEGLFGMKIDVQGTELSVFRGGDVFIKDQVSFILCEASLTPMYQNSSDLFSINKSLEDFGFTIFNIYQTVVDKHGKALWTDALWVKKELDLQSCLLR